MFSAIANYFRLGISGRHFPKEYREGTLEYRVWKYINDHGFDDITRHFCTVENGKRNIRLAYMHRLEDWIEVKGWGYPAYGVVYDTYKRHSTPLVLKEINIVLLPKRLKAVPLKISCEHIAEYGFNIVMKSICDKCLEIIEFYDSFIPKIKTLSEEVYKHALNVNADEKRTFVINAYDGELKSVLITPGMLSAFEDAVRHQFESTDDIEEFHRYCIERFRIELQKDKNDSAAHHSFPLAQIPMPENWYNLRAKYLDDLSKQNKLDDSCKETLTEISRSKVLAPHSVSNDNTDYYQGGKD